MYLGRNKCTGPCQTPSGHGWLQLNNVNLHTIPKKLNMFELFSPSLLIGKCKLMTHGLILINMAYRS